MASPVPNPGSLERLADQLQQLSQLTESLTYRLLDLEERLQGHEEQWQERLEAVQDTSAGEELELRLLETEDRLVRMESLLGRLDQERDQRGVRGRSESSVAGATRLSGLSTFRPGPGRRGEGGPADDSFPDDGDEPGLEPRVA